MPFTDPLDAVLGLGKLKTDPEARARRQRVLQILARRFQRDDPGLEGLGRSLRESFTGRIVDEDDPGEDFVDTYSGDPLPRRPTAALAGSGTKIEVMTYRVAHHEQPFHPDDEVPDPFRLGRTVEGGANGFADDNERNGYRGRAPRRRGLREG